MSTVRAPRAALLTLSLAGLPGCLFLSEPPTSVKRLEDSPEGAFLTVDDGQVVHGEWAVEVALTSTLDVEGTLFLDGEEVQDGEGDGFTWLWDTTGAERGPHELRLEVEDEVRRDEEVVISVIVDQLPVVRITTPDDGDELEGDVAVEAEVEDDGEVERVELRVDGEVLDSDDSEPWQLDLDTCRVDAGDHTLAVVAIDDAGSEGSAELSVQTTRPLAVDLTVSDTVLSPDEELRATIDWDGGVDRFSFLLDGDEVAAFTGTDDGATCLGACPDRCTRFEVDWDTSGLAEGTYALEALLEDSTGRSASDSTTVTVDHDQDGDGYDAEGYGGTDCDDTDDAVHPGADEACDDVDNDCDGSVDEGFDADGDGHAGHADCPVDASWVDCDDADDSVHPDADEVCGDGVDNDCDGPDEACRVTGEADVDALAHAWWDGETADDFLGNTLADVGDVDGDGVTDLLFGAYNLDLDDDFGEPSGGWYLVAGDVAAGAHDLGSATARIVSDSSGRFFGFSHAATGDLNGDGYDNLALGEPDDSDYDGAIYLFLGPLTGQLGTRDADDSLADRDSYFTGRALAAGDFDRDDVVDIVSGACIHNYTGTTLAWWSGPTGSSDTSPTGSAQDGSAAAAGCVVTNVGDVDGDGRDDLLVAGPEDSTNSDEAGGAWLITELPESTGEDLQDLADSFIRGSGEGNQAGWELAAAGDTDQDGYDDVLVGAPYYDEDDGRAWLFLGPLGTTESVSTAADTTFVGADAELVGQALAAADHDGDGTPDVFVGAPVHTSTTGAGAVALFYSPVDSGSLDVPGDGELVIGGEETAGFLGSELAPVTDLDGDGTEELLLSASEQGDEDAGRVFLLLGQVAH